MVHPNSLWRKKGGGRVQKLAYTTMIQDIETGIQLIKTRNNNLNRHLVLEASLSYT